MIVSPTIVRVLIAMKPVDFCKGIIGQAAIVAKALAEGQLHAGVGRRRARCLPGGRPRGSKIWR
jgi:hypothetical protein